MKRLLELSVVLLVSAAARAQVDAAAVPTTVDVVERGVRTRVDLGGRYTTVGTPAPPVRLEVDDLASEEPGEAHDVDVGGSVIFGWDRPYGAPLIGDFMAQGLFDANPDGEQSLFRDHGSAAPRARLYSAFVGLSFAPGELLEPLKVSVGRMTEIAESPITYDGAAAGVALRFKRIGHVNAKVWGGLDAPQFIVDDPFTRVGKGNVRETWVDDSGLLQSPGSVTPHQRPLDAPLLNPVGGVTSDGRIFGVGWLVSHTVLPTVQRSRIGAGYQLDVDALLLDVMADVRASDFLPRRAGARADLFTWDGVARVGLDTSFQFLEDVCAYDCTFRAFQPAGVFARADAEAVEAVRVRDQLRHLNFGPEQEHVHVRADAEAQLPLGFSALVHGRLKRYLDDADLDYSRAHVLAGGGGGAWSGGSAIETGVDVTAGAMDTGTQAIGGYDLRSEGVQRFVEGRVWVRNSLFEGKLLHLAEVMVRRQDLATRSYRADGQWGGSVSTSLRYDVFDFWGVSARVDADALAPMDALNASHYIGVMLGTTFRF